MSFVHLVARSHYSFMRGASSIPELITAAREMGMKALALTDVNGLYGSVFFWQLAREFGIQPILGALAETGEARAALLVKDRRGYERLCRLLTDLHLEPGFDLASALAADRAGLVVLSADPGLLDAVLRASGPQDLYVALGPGGDDHGRLRYAHEHQLPPLATADVHFVRPGQHHLHRILRAIALNTTLPRVPAAELASPAAWLADAREMARRFPHCPEALANAAAVAEQCMMSEPPWSGLLFPAFEGLGEAEAFRLLRARALAGARVRYGRITPAVRARLDHELSVIQAKGFSTYFLVVEDIVRRFPITCGRGSAAASIVSYCLMITHVEPIRHNLFFERFLNPGRTDPPDIDVDFPWDTRDDVLDYVFKKYGERNAAMVANHVCLQARATVRELGKVYGLPAAEIKRVTGRMRHLWDVRDAQELVRAHPLFRDLKLTAPWPEILRLSRELEGMPRHLSVHCGGVVIAPGRLSGRVPIERAAKGVNIIQWEKDQTEDGGLVKIDLLGNRSLAVIRDALGAVNAHEGTELIYRHLKPLDDPAAQALVARGDTVGVFYVESPAMRQLQQKTGTGDFERLVVHSSIIRPAANAFIREYVRRLHGGTWAPLHPRVEEILADTFGIMCYQEDVCKVAMALAGFDAVAGDGLRKVLSKKHKAKKLAEYRGRFYHGAALRGASPETIDQIWEMIMSFSGYSFCKPHSASYALVSFKSAWLRAHHPAEFMAAVISNRGGYYDTFAYISEARRMGLAVLGPDVNASAEAYTGRGRELRVGLMQIKGLTQAGRDELLGERAAHGPYRSWADFLARTRLAPADARLLVKAGCFDALEGESARPALLWRLAGEARHDPVRRAVPLPLFAPPERELPRPAGYDEATLLRHETETLGLLVSRHPLTLYLPALKSHSYVPAAELARWVGKRVTTVGWFVTGKLVATKDDEPMEFLSFEDTTALYETTFFPDAYRRFCPLIDRERPFLLSGRVEQDFGAITLTVDQVRVLEPFQERQKEKGKRQKEEGRKHLAAGADS
jgi:error-prone DNA polymerase